MSEPNSTPVSSGSLATFWAIFHFRRNLRRKPLRRAAVFVALFSLALAGGLGQKFHLLPFVVLTSPALLALFFASGVLREEIEDQTLTYAYTRPVNRGHLYIARIVAAAGAVICLSFPMAFAAGLSDDLPTALRFGAVSALACLVYSAVFGLVGLILRAAVPFSLAFLVLFDAPVSEVPGFLSRLTVQVHLRTLSGLPSSLSFLSKLGEPPEPLVSVVTLAALAVAAAGMGAWRVSTREVPLAKG